jgi:RNA polymerase sigma-70 factor (ECF subfamily)
VIGNAASERELIEAYLCGDSAAHRQLDVWIVAVVLRRAWRLGEEQHDLAQEVHLRLLRRFENDGFRSDSALKTFVQAIAKHVCIDAIRRRQRWQTTPFLEEQFPMSNDSPLETLDRRQRASICFEVLHRLSDPCRELFRLILDEELSYEGIATRLEVPSGTVKSRLARCRDRAVVVRRQLLAGGPASGSARRSAAAGRRPTAHRAAGTPDA